MQTVWTDDVPTTDDDEEPENFSNRRPENFSIPDEDYDDPSHEIAIHIQEPEEDGAAAIRTGLLS